MSLVRQLCLLIFPGMSSARPGSIKPRMLSAKLIRPRFKKSELSRLAKTRVGIHSMRLDVEPNQLLWQRNWPGNCQILPLVGTTSRSFVPNGSFGGKTARGLPANTRGSFPVLVAGSPTQSTGPQSSRPNFVNSKNIALLLSTWNATLDEADARLGGYRGTRVGEASHPGPRPRQASMCTEFRLRSLNCQSPNGAWSFFADCCEFAERQVIALQETRMAPAEEAAFLRYALKQGFHAHSVCGELDRGGRPRGRSFTFG